MWTFNDDGTVEVQLIGRVAKLRRPKLGEVKSLRQTLESAQGSAGRRAKELALRATRLGQLNAEERLNGGEAMLDEIEWVREETAAVRDIGEDIRVMWLALVLNTLDADGRSSNEDEFPAEILEGDWQPVLINHWMSGQSTANPTDPGVV